MDLGHVPQFADIDKQEESRTEPRNTTFQGQGGRELRIRDRKFKSSSQGGDRKKNKKRTNKNRNLWFCEQKVKKYLMLEKMI